MPLRVQGRHALKLAGPLSSLSGGTQRFTFEVASGWEQFA